MAKVSKAAPTGKGTTIGEIEDLLNGAYGKLSIALRRAPPEQSDLISTALDLIEWVLNQLIIQDLHQDALILGKLSAQLKKATAKLNQLKTVLTQLSNAGALGTSLLNTIGTILPFL